jgi:phosphoglucosamine mutase
MNKKYFGTDGIRGRVGEGCITVDFFLKLGFAVGSYLRNSVDFPFPRVVIGKDTRVSGYVFESALEAGLLSAGCKVFLVGPMPTPAVAYLTRTFHASLGIVVSASHNPHYDNGIKFFNGEGNKLSDQAELEIEDLIDQPLKMEPPHRLGKADRIYDASGRYIEFCKRSVPNYFNLRGKKIVLDCAHGATYDVAPCVFKELGANVVTIGCEPNGFNINENVGSTSTEQLQKKVIEEEAFLGVAFDGDGDRVLFVDAKGRIVDGDELAYIIAVDHKRLYGGCDGVVGTLMTNLGVEIALREQGIDFVRSKVGDRYVKQKMKEKKWLFGAESSGHIICNDVTTTGDGIVAALKVIYACCDTEKSLEKLCEGVKKTPQVLINVSLKNPKVLEDKSVAEKVSDIEASLADKGRVLLRESGTEPVVRVMVEGQDEEQVTRYAQDIAKHIEQLMDV